MDSYFILLNKPAGISSHACLTRFKRAHGLTKVGHHGTLDPFASGLLLVGVNEATKFFPYVDDSQKVYRAEIFLGRSTDTLDRTGSETAVALVPALSEAVICERLAALVGKGEQVPPAYSAVKVDGVPSYKLARKGVAKPLRPRPVEIFDLELISWETPLLIVRARVSRGTYVRVLGAQIAACLGTVGHLTGLLREELCGLGLKHALAPEAPLAPQVLLPIPHLLTCQRIILKPEQARDLCHGKRLPWPTPAAQGRWCAFSGERFLGMAEASQGGLKPLRLVKNVR